MSGLDAPSPPLHRLSAKTTKRVEATDHVLPDSVEVLKENLGKNPRSNEDAYWVYDAFMRAPSYD